MKQFRFSQKVAFYNDQSQLLIFKFAKDKIAQAVNLQGEWDLPGGGVEWNESLPLGLERELQEEIGNDANYKIQHPLGVIDWLRGQEQIHNICVVYKGQFISGKIQLSEEHDEYKWINLLEITTDMFSFGKQTSEIIKILQNQ